MSTYTAEEKNLVLQKQILFQDLHRIIYFEGWYNWRIVAELYFIINLLDNLQEK